MVKGMQLFLLTHKKNKKKGKKNQTNHCMILGNKTKGLNINKEWN